MQSSVVDSKSIASTMGTLVDNGVKAIEIWEKITSTAYSEKERGHLTTLKTLYQDHLSITAPVCWELDEKHCPTHRIKSHDWSRYVHQLQVGKDNQGYFHYYAKLIAQYTSSYLQERSNRNRMENGKSGDVLEQFFSEWIHFALNELPTFDCSERSIQKIKQRISYIKTVKNYPNLFEYGSLTREKNKFDVFVNIEQQLEACLELANQEILRKCARDEFTNCRRETATLLASGVNVLYYLRSTKVHHEPLDFKKFSYEVSQPLSVAASKIYPKLRESHTGNMLHEIIVRSGLESFGASTTLLKPQPIQACYYNENFQPLPIKWQTKKDDLPPWVTDKNQRLIQLQTYSESLLRIAQLKKLIEEAYDLVGGVGDVWAYGDKEGKKSLETLLFLLEAELADFDMRFKSLYDYHDKSRATYNHEQKVNASDDINRNFGNVTHQKEMIEKASSSLKTIVKSIHTQMTRFPKDAPQIINEKKKAFYRGISQFIKKFRPEQNERFYYHEKNNTAHQKDTFSFIISVKKDMEDNKDQQWQLGEKYEYWMKGYFARNHSSITEYQQLATRFSTMIEQSFSIEDIKKLSAEITQNIKAKKDQIEAERPKWRFKWGFWPIRTKGWPFNRDANEFAENLLKELSIIEDKIPKAVTYAESRMQNQPSSEAKQVTENIPVIDPRLMSTSPRMPIDNGLTESDKEALKTIPNEHKEAMAKVLHQANEPLASNLSSTAALSISIPSLPKPPTQKEDNPPLSKTPISVQLNNTQAKTSLVNQTTQSVTAMMKLLEQTRDWNEVMEECLHGNSLKIFFSGTLSFNFFDLLELRKSLRNKEQKIFATRCYALIGEVATTLKSKILETDTLGTKQADLFIELLRILIDPTDQQKIQLFEKNLALLGESIRQSNYQEVKLVTR